MSLLLDALFCSSQAKPTCISVYLGVLFLFYERFGWSEQNFSSVFSEFIGFSVISGDGYSLV
jgi:hypothetical protein